MSVDNSVMKIFVTLAFVLILISLATALFFMMRGKPREGMSDEQVRAKRMAQALTMRIGVSVLLFLIVLVSYSLGWIHPTGFAAGQ